MEQPQVFVVVLNWNLKDDTIACVESVLAGSYAYQRVVVVDNGSQDGSSMAFANHFGDKVDLILNRENLGFAKGVNTGIRHALNKGADYVLLLNSDTIVDARLVEHLIGAARSDSHPGVLGPAIYYYDEPQRFWRLGAVHKQWLPIPMEIGRDTVDTGQFATAFEVDYVTGCAMWVPVELFETVGFLDEQFFMYYEDADFCRRVRNAGYGVTVVPQARVWHKVSRSAEQNAGVAAYQRVRNRIIFYNRYGRWPQKVVANLYIMASTLAQMLQVRKEPALAACLWRGLQDGWHARGQG